MADVVEIRTTLNGGLAIRTMMIITMKKGGLNTVSSRKSQRILRYLTTPKEIKDISGMVKIKA